MFADTTENEKRKFRKKQSQVTAKAWSELVGAASDGAAVSTLFSNNGVDWYPINNFGEVVHLHHLHESDSFENPTLPNAWKESERK